MSYYRETNKAAQWLDQQMSDVLNGGELNISRTILKATAMFQVGEKVITKRIAHWRKAFPSLKEEDGVITFVRGEI